MINEFPNYPAIYWNVSSVNFYMVVLAILTYYILGLLLFFQKRESITEVYRKIRAGYGAFTIFFGSCRLFFLIGVLVPDYYDVYTVAGYLCANLGVLSGILIVEKYLVHKTRYLFSIIGIVISVMLGLGIAGILSQDFLQVVSSYGSPVMLVLLVILYMYLAIKGTATIRKNAVLMIVAMFMIGLGAILDAESITIGVAAAAEGNTVVLELYYSLVQVILIVGALLFFKATR